MLFIFFIDCLTQYNAWMYSFAVSEWWMMGEDVFPAKNGASAIRVSSSGRNKWCMTKKLKIQFVLDRRRFSSDFFSNIRLQIPNRSLLKGGGGLAQWFKKVLKLCLTFFVVFNFTPAAYPIHTKNANSSPVKTFIACTHSCTTKHIIFYIFFITPWRAQRPLKRTIKRRKEMGVLFHWKAIKLSIWQNIGVF